MIITSVMNMLKKSLKIQTDIKLFSDMKTKIEASKLFIQLCREKKHKEEGFKFIFWSLMILAVDKYNADEYLSIICDFAEMLQITDEEFEDIVYQVKETYSGSKYSEYEPKSELVRYIFWGF